MSEVTIYKRLIWQCYSMLLNNFLRDCPIGALSQWEKDVGKFEEQWEEAPLVVQQSSLNVAQHASQLYLLLRVHYILERLFRMGVRENLTCTGAAGITVI